MELSKETNNFIKEYIRNEDGTYPHLESTIIEKVE